MMKYRKILLGIILCFTLVACGGSSGGGTGGEGNGNFSSASSQLCDELSGLEAVYWDFINGVPRGDLPSTAFTIPFDIDFSQSPYANSNSLLLGFSVPLGWTVTDASDASGFAIPATVVGADLIKNDRLAVWRYMLSAQITGNFTSAAILSADINAGLNFIGNPPSVTEQCEINLQQNGVLGLESIAAKVVRAGDFTIMARTQVIIVNGVSNFYNGFLSLAPTQQNSTLINDIFVPMITQLIGGGSDFAACEDGEDNDGDGNTDYPNDPQCQFPDDDSESI